MAAASQSAATSSGANEPLNAGNACGDAELRIVRSPAPTLPYPQSPRSTTTTEALAVSYRPEGRIRSVNLRRQLATTLASPDKAALKGGVTRLTDDNTKLRDELIKAAKIVGAQKEHYKNTAYQALHLQQKEMNQWVADYEAKRDAMTTLEQRHQQAQTQIEREHQRLAVGRAQFPNGGALKGSSRFFEGSQGVPPVRPGGAWAKVCATIFAFKTRCLFNNFAFGTHLVCQESI